MMSGGVFARREQTVPGFGRIAGDAGRNRGQLREGRQAFRRGHRDGAQLTSLNQKRSLRRS